MERFEVIFGGVTSPDGVGQSLSNTVHTNSILSFKNERIEFVFCEDCTLFDSFDVRVKSFCCL
jgi:hypothetical protein